ncbi:MAG: hypothetical protein K2N51_16905 [Lachnospiraceae bacterium]|nr:hypothetical protein [Lachnospiraceae bacterium]
MNPYNPYFFNNYQNGYPNYMAPQMNRLNNLENQYQAYQNQNMNQVPNMNQTPQVLQGKAVDSIDVVKAMDVPLDGSITYFPKTDGTAIYTKQLQSDGTSRINTYEISINSGNMPSVFPNNGVNKEDIEKIYSDISEVKKSLEDNLEAIHREMNSLLNRFDEFQGEMMVANEKNLSSNNKTKGAK